MKKIVVTGANKGIGYEVARQLAALGHFVYLGSRDQQKGREAGEDGPSGKFFRAEGEVPW